MRIGDRLSIFWDDLWVWSQATFGTTAQRGPEGPLKHLIKEANEALEKQNDLMEYVDCLFLVVDAAQRAGFSYNQLMDKAFEKLEINRRRRWGSPSGTEPVEHVREET